MPRPDRLAGLDASFLALEQGGAHMHVASCMTFAGPPPGYDALLEAIERRLALVPRYRQRIATVPLQQGRPVWVDDPHFNLRYHVRHTALPAPGGEPELKRLAGRVFSQRLDRSKPLWEIWLVEGLAGDRFALLAKTHHALVDGISGVDITTVLFDAKPDPAPIPAPERPWVAHPPPSGVELVADALYEHAGAPAGLVRGVGAAVRRPRHVLGRARDTLVGVGALASAGRAAPASPLNRPVGPHRRFTWVNGELAELQAIKRALGGSVNDVVLAAVAGALGRWLRRRGQPTRDLVLRALVPVSVRADVERGALGNRVSAMYAPLPVGVADPIERLGMVRDAMSGLKDSGQAIGAGALTELTGFAPPTVLHQAARLVAHQRFFNLVVTNVPGPQYPLYVLGRRLLAIYPLVPLAANQTLGIAVMSYDGQLNFGLNADYDAVPDLDDLADDLRASLDELSELAGRPGRRDGAPDRGRGAPARTR